MYLLVYFLLLFSQLSLAQLSQQAWKDRVYSIPNVPQLSSATYSGYLKVGDTGKSLHYVFVESQNDPYNDPLLIWTNGGPGCSSMLALLQEHGPFYLQDYGDNIYINQYPWNLEANVVYVEQPAGVGYSMVKESSQLTTNDTISSADFLLAVQSFFNKFSQYKVNNLWITGQSYGGIYVPWLAKRILQYNTDHPDSKMNLQGIIVGNGAAKWEYDTNMAYLNMSYYHSMYPPAMRKELVDNTCRFYLPWLPNPTQPAVCQSDWNKFESYTSHINIYDIYRRCYIPPAQERSKIHEVELNDGTTITYTDKGMTAKDYTPWKFFSHDQFMEGKLQSKEYGDDSLSCSYDKGMADFMNSADVREALHIPNSAPAWVSCSEQMVYIPAKNASVWIYPELKEAGLQILFFSGDTDGAVATLGSLMWIKQLGWETIEDWTPWKVDGKVAGYKWVLDGMTFSTIRGVGHMAPQWARKDVTTMVMNFLKSGRI